MYSEKIKKKIEEYFLIFSVNSKDNGGKICL